MIARNSWKNYLRSHQYQARIDQNKDVYDLDIVTEQSPENTLMRQQQSKLLRIAIDALPTKQNRTLLLRVNQQLSFGNIAEVMQCSVSTVKANHNYGVKTVERMIAA